jgi:hypothetical protein
MQSISAAQKCIYNYSRHVPSRQGATLAAAMGHVHVLRDLGSTVRHKHAITGCTAVVRQTSTGSSSSSSHSLTVSQCLLRWLMYQLVT